MIDINYTFVLQLINFIILLLILSKLFFTPVRKFLKEREEKKQGWIENAIRDSEAAEKLKKEYRSMLHEARQKASSIKEELVSEASAEASNMLEAARSDSKKMLYSGLEAIEKEKSAAKAALQEEVGKLSDLIISRVIS